jgi:APA family basic amino acid/polyamine antiporter
MKPKTKLKKKLGVFDLFAIASGAMISSGLFVLPGLAFYFAGPAMLIAYLIASLLMFPAVCSISELATAMPKSGGNYFFVQRSFGPLVGTIAGLLDWFSISLKSAFALLGIGGIFLYFFPDIGYNGVTYIAAATTLFFAFLNLFSVKGSGTFQIVLVFFLLVILAFFIITGFSSVNVEQFKPFNPKGWPAVFAVVGMVFVSFGGLTKVTAVAEETKDPTKNIPRAMFMAFFIISLVYLLTVFVTVGNVAPAELSGSLTPVALAAKNAIGPIGGLIITIAAALAFATTGNAGIMAASRSPLAMSKDGLIPKFFSKTSKKFGTPMSSIIFTSAFIIFTVLFLSLEVLVKTASTMMILMNISNRRISSHF